MEEKQKEKLAITIIGILGIILLVGVLFINFIIVNPLDTKNTDKKMGEIRITSEFAVKEIYASYFINELKGYLLHKKPLSGELPRINVFIKDIGKTFTTEIDEKIETYEGIIGNADLSIEINRKDFFEIIKAENKKETTLNKTKEGKIKIELKNSKGELASKGYKKFLQNFNEKIGIFDLISEKIYTQNIAVLFALMMICTIIIIYVIYY